MRSGTNRVKFSYLIASVYARVADSQFASRRKHAVMHAEPIMLRQKRRQLPKLVNSSSHAISASSVPSQSLGTSGSAQIELRMYDMSPTATRQPTDVVSERITMIHEHTHESRKYCSCSCSLSGAPWCRCILPASSSVSW